MTTIRSTLIKKISSEVTTLQHIDRGEHVDGRDIQGGTEPIEGIDKPEGTTRSTLTVHDSGRYQLLNTLMEETFEEVTTTQHHAKVSAGEKATIQNRQTSLRRDSCNIFARCGMEITKGIQTKMYCEI